VDVHLTRKFEGLYNQGTRDVRPSSGRPVLDDQPTSAVLFIGAASSVLERYHLPKLGWTTPPHRTAQLTSGSTFHAAGLVASCARSRNITQLSATRRLYRTLNAKPASARVEDERACVWHATTSAERGQAAGDDANRSGWRSLLTPSEAQDLWPLMVVDILARASADRRSANPSTSPALAPGARMPTKISKTPGCDVEVLDGVIKCDHRPPDRCERVSAAQANDTRLRRDCRRQLPLVSVDTSTSSPRTLSGFRRPADAARPRSTDVLQEGVAGWMGAYALKPAPTKNSSLGCLARG